MALTRGGFRHYDYDRMVVLFTATNVATEVACAISSAAMDDLDGTTLSVRTFCGIVKSGLGERTTAVCRTVSKSTASHLCL